jgi:hypothetical protein
MSAFGPTQPFGLTHKTSASERRPADILGPASLAGRPRPTHGRDTERLGDSKSMERRLGAGPPYRSGRTCGGTWIWFIADAEAQRPLTGG